MNTIKVAKIRAGARLPTRKNPTDAGMDFYALGDYYIPAHDQTIVRTGVTVEIPEGYMMLIKPKGRNAHLVGSGVVDANYQPGEICIRVINIGDVRYIISDGTAIAQGILIPIVVPKIEVVNIEDLEMEHTRSGKGGILGA